MSDAIYQNFDGAFVNRTFTLSALIFAEFNAAVVNFPSCTAINLDIGFLKLPQYPLRVSKLDFWNIEYLYFKIRDC